MNQVGTEEKEWMLMLDTKLTRMMDISAPLVSAPMAGWSGGELVGAVRRAGGIGMIGAGSATPPEFISREASVARKSGSFGFGLMSWSLESRPELLDLVLAENPAAVSLSFGDPSRYIEECHAAGAKVMCQVQDRDSALQAARAGADVLVAQGTDAGGHTGSVGTMVLLQIVLDIGEDAGIPVLAAGGIATGRALAGVLAMGCAGAWVGTRFCATRESLGSDGQKREILAATESDTVYTHVFDIVQDIPWPEKYAGRAIRNDFARRWHGREDELRNSAETRESFEAARARGDYSESFIYTGQAAGLIDDIPSAGEMVEEMVSDAEKRLRSTSGISSG